MPEGPEIWRAADTLNEALKGEKLTEVYFAFEELKHYEKRLTGQSVDGVEPKGKALLTRFDNGLVLYSHNQLYGKWMISDNGTQPDTNRKLRVALHNNEHSAYLYSASDIIMLSKEEVPDHSYIKNLGPDVLHPNTTPKDVLSRFTGAAFKNRKLTTLLLDQGFLSGIGNYLRSEILFVAGVHPSLKPKDCSDEQVERLADAALTLSRRSYKTHGITNDEITVQALKRENAPRSEYRFYVYKRTGNRCHKCGEQIEEITTGGRKVYYCPACQAA